MIDCISIEQCTLCGSCRNACPVDAISFQKLYLDFEYPLIDQNRCIGCNQCEKACPILSEQHRLLPGYPIAFAAKSKNEEVRQHSSSGGIFYELASCILSKGGYVCGAVFDDRFHVKHIVSNKREDLRRMMGSKYAQSDTSLIYRQIEKLLKSGEKVLFTGCPCQSAGLRSFLKKDYPNLIIADLICHGIPSDHLLQKYISLREKEYGAKLMTLEFRNKDLGWHKSTVHMSFDNGEKYQTPITEDAYMKGYFNNVTLKNACYDCQFRKGNSGSDLVLGDFWGAEIELIDIDDNIGISAVIINSPKGRELLDFSNIERIPQALEVIIQYNQNLIKSPQLNSMRDKFYTYASKHGFEKAIACCLEENKIIRILRKGRCILRFIWYAIRGKKQPLY